MFEINFYLHCIFYAVLLFFLLRQKQVRKTIFNDIPKFPNLPHRVYKEVHILITI